MSTCDICGNDLPAEAMQRFPSSLMSTLSKQAFVPKHLPRVIQDMVSADTSLEALWKMTVSVNETDWGLCPSCAAEVREFSLATKASGETPDAPGRNMQSHQASGDITFNPITSDIVLGLMIAVGAVVLAWYGYRMADSELMILGGLFLGLLFLTGVGLAFSGLRSVTRKRRQSLAKCKECSAQYSFLSARGDGLCSVCGDRADEEMKRDEEQAERLKIKNTNEKIRAWLDAIATGEEWKHYGVGLWTSLGHQASQTVNLWAGRFFGGILGDMLHSETMLMSLVAVTEKHDLYIAHLGGTVGISPERINSAAFNKATILKMVLTRANVSVDHEGRLVVRGLQNGKSIAMSFPACFIDGNEKLPARLMSIAALTQQGEQPPVAVHTDPDVEDADYQPGNSVLESLMVQTHTAWKAGELDPLNKVCAQEARTNSLRAFIDGHRQYEEDILRAHRLRAFDEDEFLVGLNEEDFVLTSKALYLFKPEEQVILLRDVQKFQTKGILKLTLELTMASGEKRTLPGMGSLPEDHYVQHFMSYVYPGTTASATIAIAEAPESEVSSAVEFDEQVEIATPELATLQVEGEKQSDDMPVSLLYLAAAAGDAGAVRALIEKGTKTNVKTSGGVTALMGAAAGGHGAVVDLLLAHDTDVNAQAELGHFALYLAAQNGHTGIVRELLKKGANVDMQTNWGATSLQVAAQQGHREIAEILLEYGATVDLGSQFVPRAIVIAMHENHTELVELLTRATVGLVRVDGLSYLGTLGNDQLPVGEARLIDGQVTISSKRSRLKKDDSVDSKQPESVNQEGQASMFVFDYERMSDAYGIAAFGAIAEGLHGSRGVCAFLDGDLEIAAGGVSGVPGLLMEIRDNGWVIGTSRADSPLIFLASIDHLHGYVAAMWTDNAEAINLLDRHLANRFPDAYLGFLRHPQRLDLPKFHDIFQPLQLPVKATYVDGREKIN